MRHFFLQGWRWVRRDQVRGIGRRAPAYCTGVGKVLLAYLPESELTAFLQTIKLERFTKNTITDPDLLKREIQLIRERGYSVDNEESTPGIRCVAAPILDASQHVIASISISGPSVRITDEKIPELADMVIETSQEISKALGYFSS